MSSGPTPPPQQPRYQPRPPQQPQPEQRVYAPSPGPQPQPRMNGLAVFAFVSSFVIGLLGLVLSFIAASQIGRDGTRGRGLAVAAMIIGAVNTLFQLTVGVFLVIGLLVGGIALSAASSVTDYDRPVPSPEPAEAQLWSPENMGTGGVIMIGPNEAERTPPLAGIDDRGGYRPGVDDAEQHVTVYVDYLCPECASFEEENGYVLENWLGAGQISLEIVPVATMDSLSEGSEYSTRAANLMACVADHDPDSALAVHRALLDPGVMPEPGTEGPGDDELIVTAQRAGAIADTDLRDCVADRAFEPFVADVTRDLTSGAGVLGLLPGEHLGGETEPSTGAQHLARVPLVIVDGVDWAQSDEGDFEQFLLERAAAG